jgi:hypothetical protein
VSYYDISEYSVRYATNAGGAWRTEQVEGDAVTSESAIAVGASGTVHVVYGSSVDVGLHHAWNDGGGWEIDAIPGGESGMIPSLALDAEGGLHVTFLYATGDGTAALRYVTNAGGDWRMDVLESGSSAGQYSAVTVDGAGAAHVAYYWPVAGWFELFHATNASGAWVSEDVDGPISEWAGSRLPAITVDESGAVELAYPASDGDVELSAEIRYATNASGGWRIETVDPDADTASWWVWMTPHRGHVHVSYDFQMYGPAGVDLESLAFRHATNASGCWRIDEIEVGGASGALAIDPGEQLHAVYVIWPMGTTELQHAVRDVSAD